MRRNAGARAAAGVRPLNVEAGRTAAGRAGLVTQALALRSQLKARIRI
jgi:hypothetical protein